MWWADQRCPTEKKGKKKNFFWTLRAPLTTNYIMLNNWLIILKFIFTYNIILYYVFQGFFWLAFWNIYNIFGKWIRCQVFSSIFDTITNCYATCLWFLFAFVFMLLNFFVCNASNSFTFLILVMQWIARGWCMEDLCSY